MKRESINLKKVCNVAIGDDIGAYHYKRVFCRFDAKGRINDYFIRKIENKVIPWYATWCQPWPVNYVDREPFRGINGFLLRSNYCGFCPYWVSESHIDEKEITIRKRERGTPVILKKEGEHCIEYVYNMRQLEGVAMPAIKKPEKPPAQEEAARVFSFFRDYKSHDDFNYTLDDFTGQDPDFFYFLMFQYFCYTWYCETYQKELSFKPDQHNKETLIYQIGAALLASYCRISTPFYSISGYDRNLWKMLLMSDCNVIFNATAIALKMFDAFLAAAEMKKAS